MSMLSDQMQLLRGRIGNLRKSRCSQDFFFTDADRAKMGATAIAAGVVGLGGVAVGASGMAMDTTEEADLIEFELDGKPVKAWVWWSVLSEGDEVEVVAERWGETWQAFGVRRLSDKIVALHPHCSRGRFAHYRASFRWGGVFFAAAMITAYFIIACFAIFKGGVPIENLIITCALGTLVSALGYGFITYRVARKMMGFVRLAEGIFEGFGWKDVKNIDLPAITKKGKKPGEPGALGILYFRY
ncbi:putative type VI secretion system effector [Burkholderia cepacia]|uniref:putative type VI secretion system effector n=1 Tax=Burkholderia cepacia TaxID=292 RepID=UPI00158E3E11|nr:putative type VI secretion system effector [Burkholderia cepacia]MDN7895624.1 putative type VI secretion system effector [Burkholderia cepacia]